MTDVHNHGPTEGPGLDCPESLIGACMRADLTDEGWTTLAVRDEPALHVTTGSGVAYTFADRRDRIEAEITGLDAAVLVTRLRWWADHIETRARETSDA